LSRDANSRELKSWNEVSRSPTHDNTSLQYSCHLIVLLSNLSLDSSTLSILERGSIMTLEGAEAVELGIEGSSTRAGRLKGFEPGVIVRNLFGDEEEST
jgi:hypothetical protein